MTKVKDLHRDWMKSPKYKAEYKALAEYRKVGTDLLLGVYGDVGRPGVIRIGDPVEVLD